MSGGVCLPPDPTRFGRWWLRNAREWQVWEWAPDCACWWVFHHSIQPDWAAGKGWRVIGPAAPPREEVDGVADVRLEGARRPVEARHDMADGAASGPAPALRWDGGGSSWNAVAGGSCVAAVMPSGTPAGPSRAVWGCMGATGHADTADAAKAAAEAAWAAWCERAGLVASGEIEALRRLVADMQAAVELRWRLTGERA